MIQTPKGFQLWARRDFMAGPNISVYGFCRAHENYRLTGLTFEKVTAENDGQDSPPFRLEETAAQILMDTLWDCGIRPTSGAGTAGAMAAAQAHLKDLQGINTKLVDFVTRERKAKA